MKKTVSIQISGMLFHVDDDAYAALDEYLQSIRTHFAHLADRDEIVSDIESRIAETFHEKLKKSKQTITMKDVEALMKTMGTTEDFEKFEEENESDVHEEQEKKEPADARKPRRFYRNPDDKVIAGVASGIASYFNIDPVIIRVIFVVLGFMHGVGIIAYIILWIAMPLAKTHSERMEMSGEPMTLSKLNEKIQRSTHTFETADFTSIYARGGIRLQIREGKTCSVAGRGSPHDLRNMDIHVANGMLRIERMQGHWWGFIFHGFRHVSFDITLPDLDDVNVAGACSVEIDGFSGKEISVQATGASSVRARTQAKILRVHVEGASSAHISGNGDELYATAIGASSLNARQFPVKRGHADISGASSAHVQATDTVDGHATGASSLCVYGSPTVTATASGASSVKNRDGKVEDTKGWQDDGDFSDQKKYTHRSPIVRFFSMIGKVILAVLKTIIRFVGGLMLALGVVSMIALIIGIIEFFKTGSIPYIPLGPIHFSSPVEYFWAALFGFIIIVPIILLMTFGSALVHLKRQFDVAGIVTLIAFWVVALVAGGFAGSMMIRNMENANRGPVVEQTFGAKDFDAIEASDSDVLNIRQGTGFSVTASGPKAEIDRIHLVMEKNTLVIEHAERKEFCFGCNVHSTTFTITVPALTSLSTKGLTQATVEGFTGASLTLNTSDLSRVTLSGKTDLFTLVSKDLSRVDAENFIATSASVMLADLSHADIQVTGELKGETQDLSKLSYRGTTTVDVRTSDLSKVTSQDSYYNDYENYDDPAPEETNIH